MKRKLLYLVVFLAACFVDGLLLGGFAETKFQHSPHCPMVWGSPGQAGYHYCDTVQSNDGGGGLGTDCGIASGCICDAACLCKP